MRQPRVGERGKTEQQNELSLSSIFLSQFISPANDEIWRNTSPPSLVFLPFFRYRAFLGRVECCIFAYQGTHFLDRCELNGWFFHPERHVVDPPRHSPHCSRFVCCNWQTFSALIQENVPPPRERVNQRQHPQARGPRLLWRRLLYL